MGPQHSGRQPLQLPGRNWDGTFVPVQSEGEPHRQLLMIEPGAGRPPVLSSGAKVRSWKSILRSPNPRNDALMTPTSSVVTVSTYMDTSLASQPQFPGPGGSPPELYSSVTAFLQGLNARIASDILARIEFALTPGKTRAASTPMIMITIMSSTIVNPACRLLVLRIWLTVSRWMTGLTASSVPDKPPQNKPLISIMKQLESHGKHIPDTATRKPDFGSN